jgi:pimeloyl-ACP methyl ester carboxylesterase
VKLPPLEHHQVDVGEVTLHVVTAGPADGVPVLLLHGFPEFWFGWARQLGPLVEAGYRVIVPDQRGYNTSDKPRRTRDYRIEKLVGDVIGLVDALQLDRPVLVCHDWGGAVGWQTVLTYPDRFRAFVPINMPHLGVMNRELRRWRQLKKSWYIFAFQLPGVAERLLSARDCQKLVGALFANTVHRPFTEDDLIRYREAWTQPGAIRAMVSWYRAIARHGAPLPPQATVELPSRMIWGRHDKALGFPMVEPSMAYLPNGDLHVIEDAGHFVQHDCPDQVNALLLDFLRFLEG